MNTKIAAAIAVSLSLAAFPALAQVVPANDVNLSVSGGGRSLLGGAAPTGFICPTGITSTAFTGTTTQLGRIFRDAIASVCPSKVYPGIFNAATTYNYEAFTYRNTSAAAACVTVNFDPNTGPGTVCGTNAHASIYLNAYDPANQATNFVGDVGSSITQPFAATIPAATDMVLVVTNTASQAVCGFSFEVVNLPCATGSDLSVALTDTPDPVNAGANLSYAATVTNNGPGDSNDVAVALPLPAGTTFVSADPGAGGTCVTPTVGANGTVTCTWAGATANAATRTANVVALVAANTAAGAVLNATATVSAATPDPTAANDTATATTTVATSADLSITLIDSPDPVTAGTSLTYVATATNAGPSDAQDVAINLPLPANTTLVSATVSGGTCVATNCTFAGATAPGGSRSVTYVVTVAASAANGSSINATASASSATTDPNSANNSATADTAVVAVADLSVTLTASAAQALINVPVTFTAISANNGPSDAQNVSVTITLTPDFRYSGHSATGASCTTPQIGNTGAIVCTWAGATAPGATRTVTVIAFSNNEGATAVNASTASNTTDPVANNNAIGVSVIVGFPFNEIPTLSQLGLMLLGLLVGLMGFVAIRRQG
jgi:uncharacterized repeat protein (TIGR01451 family)